MKLPKLVSEIKKFFLQDNNIIGSYERVVKINNRFLKKKENFNGMIAGSWAIEAVSGHKIEHDDIDLIIFSDLCFYIDDAITNEEHCCNVIPLPIHYLKEKAVKTNLRGELEVYVPDLTLQYCLKIIGQLEKEFPEKAVVQSVDLFSAYKNPNYKEIKNEIIFILKRCTPADFNVKNVAKDMIFAIKSYKLKDFESMKVYLKKAHRKINDSLHKKFKELRLE